MENRFLEFEFCGFATGGTEIFVWVGEVGCGGGGRGGKLAASSSIDGVDLIRRSQHFRNRSRRANFVLNRRCRTVITLDTFFDTATNTLPCFSEGMLGHSNSGFSGLKTQ